ncbi:MAG: MBL fold metallo-hydrolase [Patescibacteria group bacterium]
MKIYKVGHSCFVLEEGDTKILTDPGNTTTGQTEIKDLDAVLITHIHGDHLHLDSFKQVVKNNPEARIIGNQGVVDLLAKEGIEAEVINNEDVVEIGGFKVKAFETDHHPIYEGISLPRNTGFLFNEKVYHPGDAMSVVLDGIHLLGIPIGAPFAGMREFIEYGKKVMPKKAIPTHDGNLKELGPFAGVPKMLFEKMGIEYIPMTGGDEIEI